MSKSPSSEQSHPKRVSMSTATKGAIMGVGSSKLFRICMLPQLTLKLDMEVQDLRFVLSGFNIVLVPFLSIPIPTFWNGNIPFLPLYVGSVFVLIFIRAHNEEFALNITRHFRLFVMLQLVTLATLRDD